METDWPAPPRRRGRSAGRGCTGRSERRGRRRWGWPGAASGSVQGPQGARLGLSPQRRAEATDRRRERPRCAATAAANGRGGREPGPAHGAEPCAVTTGPAHEPCGDTTTGAAARAGLERRGQRCGGGHVVPGVGPRLTASSGARSAGGAGSGPAASPGRGEEAVGSLAPLLSRQWECSRRPQRGLDGPERPEHRIGDAESGAGRNSAVRTESGTVRPQTPLDSVPNALCASYSKKTPRHFVSLY